MKRYNNLYIILLLTLLFVSCKNEESFDNKLYHYCPIKLLALKETLNDTRTIQQINELLMPKEYTRIDKLIELIFLISKDLQLSEPGTNEIEELEQQPKEKKKRKASEERVIPVNFHEECVSKIQDKLRIHLIKQSRISFTTKDKSIGIICAISKPHKQGQNEKYWFAFHPHQKDFLKSIPNSFVAYGCGSPKKLFLIPFNEFEPLIENFWRTENEERMYWHVVIHERENKFELTQPQIEKGATIDITKYRIK